VTPAAQSLLAAAALSWLWLNAVWVTLSCSQHRADPARKRHKHWLVSGPEESLHAWSLQADNSNLWHRIKPSSLRNTWRIVLLNLLAFGFTHLLFLPLPLELLSYKSVW